MLPLGSGSHSESASESLEGFINTDLWGPLTEFWDLQVWSEKWKWKSLSGVRLFETPWISPWNSPGQNTGVGSHSLLQGIFPTQGLNPGLPHRRQILYQLSHRGSPQGGVGLKNCISDKFQGYIDINGPEITVWESHPASNLSSYSSSIKSMKYGVKEKGHSTNMY